MNWPPAVLLLCALMTAAEPIAEADRAAATAVMQGYDRAKSLVMAKVVEEPSRAALDFAAYEANPLMLQRSGQTLKPPFPKPDLFSLTFDGLLVPGSVVDKLAETPMGQGVIAQGMATPLLAEYLARWNFAAAESMLEIIATVSQHTWGNAYAGVPYQQITTAWLPIVDGVMQFWVELEFDPAVDFIGGLHDDDGDGLAECYARLVSQHLSVAVLERIRDDYLGRRLTDDETKTYFYELASVWYPVYNTVILKPEESRPWPTEATEEPIRAALGTNSFGGATVVIRAQPAEGVVYYFVFLVNTDPPAPPAPAEPPAEPPAAPETPAAPPAAAKSARSKAAPSPHEANLARWRAELAAHGGSWDAWAASLADYRADIRRQLDARPERLKSLFAADGSLFFRGCLEYLIAGDLRRQENERDPFPAIVDYHEQLAAKGVKLLLVVIPTRPEIYAAQAGPLPAGERIAQPYTRKLLLELGEAGVECIDLLPAFLDASVGDAEAAEPLYLFQDTHWSPRGAELAARLLAERVRLEPWYQALSRRIDYRTQPAEFTRLGDLRSLLTDPEKLQFPPLRLTARQVLKPDGGFYEDDPASPIILLGDSFCGIYQFEDCRHAGLPAHLARELGLPVDLLMAHGSGPRIRAQLLQRGPGALDGKKLVIWTVAGRDLWNYWAPWSKVAVP